MRLFGGEKGFKEGGVGIPVSSGYKDITEWAGLELALARVKHRILNEV